MDREQTAGHFQHVIDVAAFVGASFNPIAKLVRWSKVFVTSVSTCRVTVMQRYRVPEKFRRRAVGFITGVDVTRQIAQELRYLRVAVQARKDVFPPRQWVKHGVMIEM